MTNDQFTEEHKLEMWRHLHAGHLERQTSALETIRNYLFYLLLIVVIGVIAGVMVGISSGM